jgi:hypothetical protein
MANKKISDLDDLPVVTSDDLAVVVDISTLSTRKASMANLKSYFQDDLPRPQTEMITITASHLSTKSFSLTHTPNVGYNVTIMPQGGCLQFINHDFIVTANQVNWDGYQLDGLLEENDILLVSYYY